MINDFLQSDFVVLNSFLIQIQKAMTTGKKIKLHSHITHTYTHVRIHFRKGRKAFMMDDSGM